MRIPRGLRVKHKRMRRYLGWVRAHGRTIHIDLSADVNPLRTLLHELIHLRHPEWNERRVLWEERRRWRRLTDRDLRRLARLLGKVE